MSMTRGYRFEFKYLLDPGTARQIERIVSRQRLVPDKHAGSDGTYVVTSLYFDTYEPVDYDEKAGGMLQRKKVRLRLYGSSLQDARAIFLEQKDKYNMCNGKKKVRLDHAEALQVQNAFFAEVLRSKRENGSMEAEALARTAAQYGLRPFIIVQYVRSAYVGHAPGMRITFDRNLAATTCTDLSSPSRLLPICPGAVIMEVKYEHMLPPWFHFLVTSFELQRQSVSKYTLAVETLFRSMPLAR